MKYILPMLLLTTTTFLVEAASETEATSLQITGILEQGDPSIKRPHNSQTQQAVVAEFGEPDNKVAAIGEPPIIRWEYAKFNVFFEYDRVIHSVLKK